MKGSAIGLTTCTVCGRDFALIAEERYTARDDEKSGLTVVVSDSESKLYDAFDCPHCGCQNIVQGRKRLYNPMKDYGVVNIEQDKQDNNHNGCIGCRYEDCTSEDYPCSECCKNFFDHYEKGEGTTDGK